MRITTTPNSSTRRAAAVVLALFAASALAGCAGSMQKYIHPEADLSFYTKVGVVPFRSLAADRWAGEKFTVEFTTALLNAELFEVVDYGVFSNDVAQALGSRSPSEGLSKADLLKIGEATGVEGVIVGTVSTYEMTSSNSGRFPVISVEARLLDVATGTVVWTATVTDRGGPKTPIIGVGEVRTLGGLSQRISRRMVNQLK